MKWSEEKINKQKEYFREQRINPTGNFTEFVVSPFYYIYTRCKEKDDGLVSSKITYEQKLIDCVYEGVYEKPDHMARDVVDDCVKKLKEMNYIGFKKVDEKWYIYIK